MAHSERERKKKEVMHAKYVNPYSITLRIDSIGLKIFRVESNLVRERRVVIIEIMPWQTVTRSTGEFN